MAAVLTCRGDVVQDPSLAKLLFNDMRSAWLWLPLRLWLGYQWLDAVSHKFTPAWLETGEALRGFWKNAVTIPAQGRPPISFDWYRAFL